MNKGLHAVLHCGVLRLAKTVVVAGDDEAAVAIEVNEVMGF